MPEIVSFEISEAEISAAVVETSFRDYKVTAFHREARRGDDTPLVEQLRHFVESHQLPSETVLSVLPPHSVSWRVLKLPFRDRKRLQQTLPFEIENHIPFDLEDVVIDYQVLRREGSGTTVLVGVVPKAELEAHISLLSDAGIDPKLVDLAPLAAINILKLVPDLPADLVFIDRDAASTSIVPLS